MTFQWPGCAQSWQHSPGTSAMDPKSESLHCLNLSHSTLSIFQFWPEYWPCQMKNMLASQFTWINESSMNKLINMFFIWKGQRSETPSMQTMVHVLKMLSLISDCCWLKAFKCAGLAALWGTTFVSATHEYTLHAGHLRFLSLKTNKANLHVGLYIFMCIFNWAVYLRHTKS